VEQVRYQQTKGSATDRIRDRVHPIDKEERTDE